MADIRKKLKKIEDAEGYIKSTVSGANTTNGNTTAGNANRAKAMTIYRELCLMPGLNPEEKFSVLQSMMTYMPEEGREMLLTWRDVITFTPEKEMNNLISLLAMIAKSQEIDSYERMTTAVTLYNRGIINVCYECFENIALDKSVLVSFRIDACRYLYGSEVSEKKELAQEILLEILDDMSLPSNYRYRVIAGFISKSGVVSYFNTGKIKIAYDEAFVYGLQYTFFNNEKNDIQDRILSGQHILQISSAIASEEEKQSVTERLLEIVKDESQTENVRADAADVIVRLGTEVYVVEARKLIKMLGETYGVNKKSDNILERVKTVYTNSQNVHDEDVAETVTRFIEKMIADTSIRTRPYHEIHQEVGNFIRGRNLEPTKRHFAYKALNRVAIDTATFTAHKTTLAEIVTQVWIRIQKYVEPDKTLLEDRLIEELVDMGEGVCSSGHSARFVNVLATVDKSISISYETQLIANVAGRMTARIKAVPDPNIKAAITMGMLDGADGEDKEIYDTFVTDNLKLIRTELYDEFVRGKYITESQFIVYFERATENWIKN